MVIASWSNNFFRAFLIWVTRVGIWGAWLQKWKTWRLELFDKTISLQVLQRDVRQRHLDGQEQGAESRAQRSHHHRKSQSLRVHGRPTSLVLLRFVGKQLHLQFHKKKSTYFFTSYFCMGPNIALKLFQGQLSSPKILARYFLIEIHLRPIPDIFSNYSAHFAPIRQKNSKAKKSFKWVAGKNFGCLRFMRCQ